MDITPFLYQDCRIQRNIHQIQINLIGEIHKVNIEEKRVKEIEAEYISFRTRLIEATKKIQIQLTLLESNLTFPEHLPQKNTGGL